VTCENAHRLSRHLDLYHPLRNRHLLILTFLGAFMPNLYFALTGLVVAVATLAIMRGLPWTRQPSREDSASDSRNHSHQLYDHKKKRWLSQCPANFDSQGLFPLVHLQKTKKASCEVRFSIP